MEDIDGGLHPAADGQSLDEDEDDEEGAPAADGRQRVHGTFYVLPNGTYMQALRLLTRDSIAVQRRVNRLWATLEFLTLVRPNAGSVVWPRTS